MARGNLGVLVVLFVMMTGLLSADQGEAAQQTVDQRIPHHDAAAVIKLVAVRVLDKAGRPITGLGKEDFILTDNGARQTITEFENYVLDEAGARLGATAHEVATPLAPLLKRRLFIFLDLQGNDENGAENAKAAAIYFVDTQVRPDDEVGVIGFSPMRGFFIQEYLTSDLGRIRKAIERARELAPSGASLVAVGPEDAGGGGKGGGQGGQGNAIQSEGGGGRAGNEGSFNSVTSSVFIPGTRIFQREDFLPRMFDFAEALKYVPGNKSLVLFSGRNIGPARSLGRAFAASGTPVFAVNTKNWIMKGFFNAIKEKHIWREHSLKDLSLASGGEYFADIEAVQTIAGGVQVLTGNFYVLGYYIKESWDGNYHKVSVELEKPGYRVLAQEGYFNPRPFSDMSDFEKELQLFGLLYADAPATDAPDLPMTGLAVAAVEAWEGVILVEIAVDAKGGVPPAKVEFIALILDEDRTPVISRKCEIELSPYNGKILVFCVNAPTETGKYDVRVVVRDVGSGRSAVGRLVFEVPASAGDGLVLSSPVLLVPGDDTRLVRMDSGSARRGKAAVPNLVNLYPFIPKNHRIVVREVESGIVRITAVLPICVPTGEAGAPTKVEVGARLLPKSGGEETPLDLQAIQAMTFKDGREFLILTIDLPRVGARAGEYDLEITAEDTVSGKRGSVRTPLVLK